MSDVEGAYPHRVFTFVIDGIFGDTLDFGKTQKSRQVRPGGFSNLRF